VGVAGPLRDRFYETIGRPDLIERFSSMLYFEDDKAELWPILDATFAIKTTAEWCELLGAAGLRFAPVRNHAEVVDDPGVLANEYIARTRTEAGLEVAIVTTPVRFSGASTTRATLVPELGQHTEEVLLEAGYSWDEIADLSAAGAI
jgi:crotonobetainyl-CoA:carnitine CoA-transferase CaiB-like acyl-CoA transferase